MNKNRRVRKRVLDFTVKINILSGEFDFDCLQRIILLRPLHTLGVGARATGTARDIRWRALFFFLRNRRITPPSPANFLDLYFGRAEHFGYRHLLYRGICSARAAVTMIATRR